MFDFLKKPTHHHAAPQKSKQTVQQKIYKSQSPQQSVDSDFKISVIPHILKNQTKNNKKEANVKKYQQNSPLKLNQQVERKLKQFLGQSQRRLNDINANEMIKKQMKILQKRVFTRYTASNEQDYLHKLYEKTPIINNLVRQSLGDLISNTVNNIAQDIQSNNYNYEVYKKKILTKQQIIQAQKNGQLYAIKIKQGQISSKVGQLKMQINLMEDTKIISKAKQIVQKDSFNKDHQKAKQIQKFIQLKKLQKQQLQRKKKQDLERKKLKQLEKKIQQEKQVEKAKSQRHAKLIQKYQAKQMQKQKRKQQIQTQKQKFARFLKQYKKAKPLYQQKIQEQIKRQIQQKRLRFQQMSQRKGLYNPISFQDLQDFQKKYLQLKRQQEEKKKIELQIKRDQEKFRIQQMRQKHYKGKYRYLVLEQMVNKQAKAKQQEFAKKLLVQKKRAYSVDIKQKYKPKIDQNKRIQSQKFISQSQRKYKQKGTRRVRIDSSDPSNFNTISYQAQQQQPSLDPRKQGQKYRRLFKQYIHDKIQRGQIKKPQTIQSQELTPVHKINYLKQIRDSRQTKNSSFSYHSLDAQSRIKRIKKSTNGDVSLFKIKAQQLDQKARRQQLKLKYSNHTPNDQKQLQQNYLASIKAKLQLLNNVK